MPVRDTRRPLGGTIFIPQRMYTASWMVTINDGTTTTDLTEYIISLNVDWVVGAIASCKMTLSNIEGIWLSAFTGGEIVTAYGEYGEASPPTNILFKGKLDNIYHALDGNGYTTTLECRQTPEVADMKIVEQFDNVLVTTAINTIIDTYYPTVLLKGSFPTTTIRFTGNFRHTDGLTAMNQIADKATMDIYIDTADTVQLFARESVNNTDEYVSYETNLKSMPKYGKDNTKIFNNVIVYGKEENNIVLLKTEEDTDSQADLWRKDLIVSDNSLTTMNEVQEFADIELDKRTTQIEEDGSVTALGLPTIKPGDNVVINVPMCGCIGNKNIRSISHRFTQTGFTTGLVIKDRQYGLMQAFNARIVAEERLTPYNNLNNMTDSYTIFFNESPPVVTLTGAEIVEERVQLISGETTGSVTSTTKTADKNISQCELRVSVNYPNHENCTYAVSNNGGSTWETIEPGILHTFTSSGNSITYRIGLVGDETHVPVFESICLLYKRV